MVRNNCSPLTATHCYRCGDCTCLRGLSDIPMFDARECPLHGADSKHGEVVSLAHWQHPSERTRDAITAG